MCHYAHLAYTSPPFVVAFWIHCTFAHFLGYVTRFHGKCCYDNQEICVFWKRNLNFIIAVYWKFSSISHRFRVICDYSLQWDFLCSSPKMAVFGRPFPPWWTYFNLFHIGQTAMSLRSIWRIKHLRALPHSGYIAQFAHFLGHVTRFHSNRCYGNQNKCIFW